MVVLGAVRRAILRRTTGGSVNADPGLGDGEERGRGGGASRLWLQPRREGARAERTAVLFATRDGTRTGGAVLPYFKGLFFDVV